MCRIEECNRAKVFLKAVTQNMDEVYTRVADVEDEESIFAADIVYHVSCMSTYLKKYERSVETATVMPRLSRKRELFKKETDNLSHILDQGTGISLSEIRDNINDKCGEPIITNKEVKLYLVEHFLDYPILSFKAQE